MLRLVEPIWLVAMAGIVVPVVVHLWNDRRGKVLRVGSVALLTGASKRMAWWRRITQWWLLILRCLLLLALALLLAGPYWQRRPVGKGWVLVLPAVSGGSGFAAPGVVGPYAGTIDSLVKAGFQQHVFSDTTNYWAGFRQADAEAPAGLSFYIFTPGLVDRFSGTRPSTSRIVHWSTYTPRDSVSHWEQRRWAAGQDSMIVLSGLSRATGTSWERQAMAITGAATGPAGSTLDTSILRYRVYGSDAKYITAAMKALARVSGKPMAVGDGGWLFWLSAKPLPDVRGYSKVWTYGASGPGAGEHVDSLVWREQAWNGRLPLLLGSLLPADTPRHDKRIIDPHVVQPVYRAATSADVVRFEDVDLRPWVWGIVFLLFFFGTINSI